MVTDRNEEVSIMELLAQIKNINVSRQQFTPFLSVIK